MVRGTGFKMIDRKKLADEYKKKLYKSRRIDNASEKLYLDICDVFVSKNSDPLTVLDTLNVVRMYVSDTIVQNAITKDERRLKRNWK